MYQDNKIWIGQSEGENIYIYPKMANRHGLIAGATGTGKTVTLKVMAESFSAMGVPVFLADVKGDLAPMCQSGTDNENVTSRVESMGLKEAGFEVFGGVNSPYVWLATPNGMPSWDFFDKLLSEAGVVGTPGAGFGTNGNKFFRLTSFSTNENTKKAMEKLEIMLLK